MTTVITFIILLISHILVLILGFTAGKQINITADVALSKQSKPKKQPRHEMKPDIYEEERIDVT